jgi:hypothetical protein
MASRSSRWIGITVALVVGVLAVAATTWALLHYRVIGGRVASPHSPSPAAPDGTQVVTVVAVDASGQPINGYRQVPQDPSNVATVFGCAVSPAAVAVDIYYCAPNAAGADVCWPSTPGTLLCLDDPWNKGLRRVAYTDPLPHVQPTPTPAPFALLAALGAGAMTAWSAPTVALTNPRPSSSPSHPRPARRRSTGRSSCGRSRSVHSVPATHTCHLPKRAR